MQQMRGGRRPLAGRAHPPAERARPLAWLAGVARAGGLPLRVLLLCCCAALPLLLLRVDLLLRQGGGLQECGRPPRSPAPVARPLLPRPSSLSLAGGGVNTRG